MASCSTAKGSTSSIPRAAKLGEVLELTDQAGVSLRLARVKPAVTEVLRRDGLLDRLGEDRTHGNVHRAVQAQVEEVARQSPET